MFLTCGKIVRIGEDSCLMQESVKYRIVVREMEEDIRSGKYAGRSLPSEAQLVKRFGVGRKTVQRAILELQHLGLVVRRKGKGTFLSKLGQRTTGLLGILIPDAPSATIFRSFSREIARIGQNAGYTFLFGEAAVGDAESVVSQTRRFAHEFVSHHVEGVIFRPLVDESYEKVNLEIAGIFEQVGIPLVLIDSDLVSPPKRSAFDVVGINNIVVEQRVVDHLLDLGRRRIAFLMDDSPMGISINLRSRLFGLASAVTAAGVEWNAKHVLTVRADDVAGVRRAIGRRYSPDAIVCGNDAVAICLMQTLSCIGKRVPEDIAVIGFDDMDEAKFSDPSLTTIHQPVEQIAEQAFRALMRRIRGDNLSPCEILMDASLVVRRSTLGTRKSPCIGSKPSKRNSDRKRS